MPRGFSVVAIIAAYNEADIIGPVVRDLIDQDISVYFLDDGSTDGTVEAVEAYARRGVICVERLESSACQQPKTFNWDRILRRKAQLASELDADWFIHHDADEFRESPWADVTLKEAISRVDALGYNAIDFASLDFRPTDDEFRGGDIRAAFPLYSDGASYDKVQIRCWKKCADVDLASTGGHEARFDGRRVFPIRFLLRHYPIRGQSHGNRKVFAERKPRFSAAERARGWHVQYEHLAEGTSFIHDPAALTRFDPVAVRIGLSMRHRGVEELEQSLVATRTDLASANAELAARSGELIEARAHLAHTVSELAHRRGEIAGLNHVLEQRKVEVDNLKVEVGNLKVEVDNLQAAVTDLIKQLDALRRSLSWRCTAPARAIYRLLTGRS